jgi:hypothetical protein
MEPVKITLTDAIAVKAGHLHDKKYALRYFVFVGLAAAIIAAYFLIKGGHASIERILVQLLLTLVGSFFLAGATGGVIYFLISPIFARRNFRQQKMLMQDMTLSWTKDRYLYTAGNSRSDIAFADLHGYRASKELLLFYITENLFHIIPLGDLGNEAHVRDLFETLGAANVKRR